MITRVSFCSSAGCFRRPGWIKLFFKKEIQVIRGTRDRETLQAAFQYSSVRVFEASEVELFTLELNCKDKLLITVMHQIAFKGQMYLSLC